MLGTRPLKTIIWIELPWCHTLMIFIACFCSSNEREFAVNHIVFVCIIYTSFTNANYKCSALCCVYHCELCSVREGVLRLAGCVISWERDGMAIHCLACWLGFRSMDWCQLWVHLHCESEILDPSSFERNFCSYCPILIILSLLQTEIICPQRCNWICHFTCSLLQLYMYLEKCNHVH